MNYLVIEEVRPHREYVDLKVFCICCGKPAQAHCSNFIFLCDVHMKAWGNWPNKGELGGRDGKKRWTQAFLQFLIGKVPKKRIIMTGEAMVEGKAVKFNGNAEIETI